MKRFLKKKWHSIPVALVSALLVLVLVAGGAFAAFATTEQTITQTIYYVDYGSITADDIPLDNVVAGGTVDQKFLGAVTVEVTDEGVGNYLHMSLDEDSTAWYDGYFVAICSPTHPGVGLYACVGTLGMPDTLHTSIQLTESGIYIFDVSVGATAGSQAGTAKVKITYTLEDEPYIAP